MNCKKLYINNTLIARNIRKGIYEGTVIINTNNEASVEYFLTSNKNDDLSEATDANKTVELTYIDMMIADAVYSLYETNQSYFTPAMILRVLSGDEKQTCRPETKLRIHESLERLKNIHIKIIIPEGLRNRKKLNSDGYEGNFLELEELERGKIKVTVKGEEEKKEIEEVKKYRCVGMPLYDFAKDLNQIISVPTDLLGYKGGKSTKDSLDNIAIKHYLVHRLEVANYKGKKGTRRNMNTIYYYHLPKRKDPKYEGMLLDLNLAKKMEDFLAEQTNTENKTAYEREKMYRTYLSKSKNRLHRNLLKIIEEFYIAGYIGEKAPELIHGDGKEIVGLRICGEIMDSKTYDRHSKKKQKDKNS